MATSDCGMQNSGEHEVADLWILETIAFKTISIFLAEKSCMPCLQRILCVWKHLLALQPNHLLNKMHYVILETILQSYETTKEQGLLQLLKEIESAKLDVKQRVKEEVVKFIQTKIVLCYYERGNIRRARRYFRDKEKSTLYPDLLNHLLNNTESTFPDQLGVKNLQKHLIPLVSDFLKKIGTPKLYQLISSLLNEKEKQEALLKNNSVQQESTNENVSPSRSLRTATRRRRTSGEQNDRNSQEGSMDEDESQSILRTRSSKKAPGSRQTTDSKNDGRRSVKATPRRHRKSDVTDEESTDDEMALSRIKSLIENEKISESDADGTSHSSVRELRSRNVEIPPSAEEKSAHDNKKSAEGGVCDNYNENVGRSPRKLRKKSPQKKVNQSTDQPAQSSSDYSKERQRFENETDADGTTEMSIRELRSRNVKIPPSSAEQELGSPSHDNGKRRKAAVGDDDDNNVRRSPRKLKNKSPQKKENRSTDQADQSGDDSMHSSQEPPQMDTPNNQFAAAQPVHPTTYSPSSKSFHRKKKGTLRGRPSQSILEIATSDDLQPSTSKKRADEPSTSKKRAGEEENDGRKKKKRIVNTSGDEGESLKWSDTDGSSISADERSKFSFNAKTKKVKFTAEEEENLKRGIKRYGVGNWAAILYHYKFHPSRTNVSLKDKYRTMKKQGIY